MKTERWFPGRSYRGLNVDESVRVTPGGRKIGWCSEVGHFEVLPNGEMGVVLGKGSPQEAAAKLRSHHERE